jgi:hypothetical protein
MKNLIFASALALSSFAISQSASANTYPSPKESLPTVSNTYETAESTMKPRVKIRLSWKDGFSVGIEITFKTAPGGNDNATGDFSARSINESGVSVKSDPKKRTANEVASWSWGASNPTMLNGATDIVVTKGATLPDGTVINVGDRLVMNANGFSIVSPRDAASGMATGKR